MRRIFVPLALLLASLLPRPSAGADKPAIAILPLQNEADPYYQLSENPASDITRLLDMARERMHKPVVNHEAQNASAMRDGLVFQLGKGLAQKGYRVFMGKDYEEFYRQLEARGREITYQTLQAYVPAQAFLLVQLQEWDNSAFDTEGKLTVAFSVFLIDPQSNAPQGIVWKNSAKKTLELEANDFLFRKRHDEMIREVAAAMLRGFPKTA